MTLSTGDRWDLVEADLGSVVENLKEIAREAPAWSQHALFTHAERVEVLARKLEAARRVSE